MDYPEKGVINLQEAVRNLNRRLKKLEAVDEPAPETTSPTQPAIADPIAPLGEQHVADEPADQEHSQANGACGNDSGGSGSETAGDDGGAA